MSYKKKSLKKSTDKRTENHQTELINLSGETITIAVDRTLRKFRIIEYLKNISIV